MLCWVVCLNPTQWVVNELNSTQWITQLPELHLHYSTSWTSLTTPWTSLTLLNFLAQRENVCVCVCVCVWGGWYTCMCRWFCKNEVPGSSIILVSFSPFPPPFFFFLQERGPWELHDAGEFFPQSPLLFSFLFSFCKNEVPGNSMILVDDRWREKVCVGCEGWGLGCVWVYVGKHWRACVWRIWCSLQAYT